MRRILKIQLKTAIDFHGHLGPYLVLGLLMGEYALKKMRARPHFGLEVKVWGAKNKPKSCLIDGLQLSTGCTYGKGNIAKYGGKAIKVNFRDLKTTKELTVFLSEETLERLKSAVDHLTSEKIAMEFYKKGVRSIFLSR
ncbi:MAG: formylmethanofuran dehydrogenase subunit E family protein [Candidatus Omnitrophota bacterium]|nr:formylmethanofuran dehydrogenase subunit E family protein [Candidatus Omnitrophota bacterium]